MLDITGKKQPVQSDRLVHGRCVSYITFNYSLTIENILAGLKCYSTAVGKG